jgi:DNA invertase Pin-like site-specific DNA recombinase
MKKARPELDRMIERLRDGDVVVVTKYDRLGRSLQDLLNIVEAIGAVRKRAQGGTHEFDKLCHPH